MSSTVTATPATQSEHPKVLFPERSKLGLLRPGHGKSVIIDWLTTVDTLLQSLFQVPD